MVLKAVWRPNGGHGLAGMRAEELLDYANALGAEYAIPEIREQTRKRRSRTPLTDTELQVLITAAEQRRQSGWSSALDIAQLHGLPYATVRVIMSKLKDRHLLPPSRARKPPKPALRVVTESTPYYQNHKKYALAVARKYYGRDSRVSREELDAAALDGLHRFAELYDPARGAPTTYLDYWVRNRIISLFESVGNAPLKDSGATPAYHHEDHTYESVEARLMRGQAAQVLLDLHKTGSISENAVLTFLLKEHLSLRYRDIAKALGFSFQAAKQNHQRAEAAVAAWREKLHG